MQTTPEDKKAIEKLLQLSRDTGLNIESAKLRRTSSRFCFGVEHGDYNGTELFGIGTDRFLWIAYKPNTTKQLRLFSGNFPNDGIVEFDLGNTPPPKSKSIANTWARFPYGVEYTLRNAGYELNQGIDAVIYGNIPGGGMSRSASLTLNLILSLLDANNIKIDDSFEIVNLAQSVENDYIGSPCGQLDQIMILFARQGLGTHYSPKTNSINYIPLGQNAPDFRIAILDTGTVRPGLEKSTYKIRRDECKQLLSLLQNADHNISCLADIKDKTLYDKIITQFQNQHPDLCDRLKYIFNAQNRFYQMLDAWKAGDIETIGQIFRADGIALRDDYKISGSQLEKMCDIARTVEGVLGERMLGGGDKGASGALILTENIDSLKQVIDSQYPIAFPMYADKYAVHICKPVEGVKLYENLF